MEYRPTAAECDRSPRRAERGYFLMDRIVHCDPDIFKAAMPEWAGYVARDKLSAGGKCHRESGMLVEVATEAALAGSMHCWVDGSLKDGDWYRHVIEDFRARYPEYQIAIVEVKAATDVIFGRVAKRAAATGRDIPPADVVDSIERVPKSVAVLADLVDFYARLDNSTEGGPPQLTKYCDHEQCYLMRHPGETERGWREIGRRFGHASSPSRSQKLQRRLDGGGGGKGQHEGASTDRSTEAAPDEAVEEAPEEASLRRRPSLVASVLGASARRSSVVSAAL